MFPNQEIMNEFELDTTGKTVAQMLPDIASRTGAPAEYIAVFRPRPAGFDGTVVSVAQNGARLLPTDSLDAGGTVNVFVRPLVGDHIHTIYNIWIHDGTSYKLVRPQFDAHLEHIAPAVDGETEYYFSKLHNGLHTHGKGLIHVHPWTSPSWFPFTDGLGAVLGAWFDTVDITVRQPPYRPAMSLAFGNGIHFVTKEDYLTIIRNKDSARTVKDFGTKHPESRIINQSGKSWKAFYWKHYLDFIAGDKPTVVTDQLTKIWMGRNLSVVTLVYGPDTDVVAAGTNFATTFTASARADIVEVTTAEINNMKSTGLYFTLRQYDGERYPSPASPDNRYQTEDLRYELRDKEL